MSEPVLFTEAEALNHTRIRTSTFRRSLKLWEELYCPLPTDSDNQKLLGKFLITLLDSAELRSNHDRRPKAERLEHQMTPRALIAIVEDYASSSTRICGYEEFLLNILRLAAKRAYAEAWEHGFDSRLKMRRMEERLSKLETSLDAIQKWARLAPRVAKDS